MSETAAPEAQPDPRDQSGRVARNILSVAASQAATWAFSAVAIVIVPRALGPTAVGQLGFSMAVWSIASMVITFGSSPLITREVAQDPAAGSRVISNVFPMKGIAWIGVSLVVFGYTVVGNVEGTLLTLLAIHGVHALVNQTNETFRSSIIGRERLGLTSTVSIIERAIVAAATIGVVLLDQGVEVVAIAGLAGLVVTMPILGVSAVRDPEIHIRPTLSEAGSVLHRALPLMFLSGALLLYREVDIITLKALADDTAVGLYAATDRLFGAMVMVPSAISFALFPTMSRRYATDPDGVLDTMRRITALLGLVTIPIAVGALMLGPELAVAILGDDFARSGGVMQIYGIVLIPVAWTVVIGMLCTISQQERTWTIVLLVSAAATVPLDLVLVPWTENQYDNAALAGALAFLVTETGAVIFGFRRILPGAINRHTGATLIRTGLAAGLMAGALVLLDGLPLIVTIIGGGIVYGVGVLVFGALRLGELATLGGPFERFARFQAAPTDLNSEGAESSSPTSES